MGSATQSRKISRSLSPAKPVLYCVYDLLYLTISYVQCHVSVVMCYNNNKSADLSPWGLSRRVLLFCIICCQPNLSFWTSDSVLFLKICLNQLHLAMYQLCQAEHTGSNQTRQRVARLAKTRNFSELFYELCINKELSTWVWFI